MDNVKIFPLIIDLIGSFFRSSRDALDRSQHTQPDRNVHEPTGLNIYSHCRSETQASIECIVFSFLTIEATINYLFFNELSNRQPKGLDKWLQQRWKKNLSIYDRFILLVNQYSTANVDNFQYLTSLFVEFITFRNRIVHAMPERYHALGETSVDENEFLIHDVELVQKPVEFPVSLLSGEIGRINCEDAKRSFEIMLLVVCFLDEQFIERFELPWVSNKGEQKYLSPRDIFALIDFRYYSKLSVESLIPEISKKSVSKQQDTLSES
jgi:hypothetical protein